MGLFKQVVFFLVLGGLFEMLVFFLWSEQLFVFVFGKEWVQAGSLTAILVFSYAVKFIVSPLSGVFIVLEKLKWASLWQSIYFMAIVALYFLKVEWEVFFVVLVIIDVLAYSIYFAMIRWVIKSYQVSLSIKTRNNDNQN